MDFDSLVTKSAEEIRNGTCSSRSKLLTIYEKLTFLSDEEKDIYKYHINRIANAIDEVVSAGNEEMLTRAERDQVAFPFEWRIHERLSKDKVIVKKSHDDDKIFLGEVIKLMARLNNKYSSLTMTERVKPFDEAVDKLSLTPKYQQFLQAFMNTLYQEGWYSDVKYFRREPDNNDLFHVLSVTVNKNIF